MIDNKFDISVLVRTTFRPTLMQAARSVLAQDFSGRIQLLLGADAPRRDDMIAQLRAECPDRHRLDVFELGYPTSFARGGLYPCRQGGALATLLAYAAAARHVIFLDDDNWMSTDHLSGLMAAIEGADWAYSLRWYVDDASGRPLCVDRWESLGPGNGVYAEKVGGFVDLNCLMFDKMACHFAIPLLSYAMTADGGGEDRLFFSRLVKSYRVGRSDRPTLYYRIRTDDPVAHHRSGWLAAEGVQWP